MKRPHSHPPTPPSDTPKKRKVPIPTYLWFHSVVRVCKAFYYFESKVLPFRMMKWNGENQEGNEILILNFSYIPCRHEKTGQFLFLSVQAEVCQRNFSFYRETQCQTVNMWSFNIFCKRILCQSVEDTRLQMINCQFYRSIFLFF